MTRRPKNPSREIPHGAGDVRERDGRWQARWIEADGARHARRFDTPDEANDFLRERWRNRRDGRSVTPAELTVGDLVRDWLDRGKDDWQPSTYATNKRYAEKHVIPAIGHIRADVLDPAQVQQWIDGMRRAGRGAHWIANCTRCVSSAYRQAMQLGFVRTNPVTGTKRPTVRKPPITTWTVADVARVDAALTDEPLWQAVYRVALTTGMRPGELRSLRWSDIESDRITIRRTMTRDADDRPTVGSQTKTGRIRTVALTPAAADALKRWRKRQAELQMAARRWDPAGYVFTSQYGGPLSATTWQKRHKRLIDALKVPPITLHGTRHTFATISLERNVHPKIVAEMMGHSSIETTLNRYSHVRLDLQQAAANALDAAIFGTTGTRNGTDG